MLGSTMILAAILAAPVITRPPNYIGVAVGNGLDEHLILEIPRGDCSAGMKVHSGRYGDLDAATELLARAKLCSRPE
jgi:hypothetical protein